MSEAYRENIETNESNIDPAGVEPAGSVAVGKIAESVAGKAVNEDKNNKVSPVIEDAIKTSKPPTVEEQTDGLSNACVHERELYLFFSFDLVDATVLKDITVKWPEIITKFYHFAGQQVAKKFSLDKVSRIPTVWKYLGDEVLFYTRITDFKSIMLSPEMVFLTMKGINKSLKEMQETGYMGVLKRRKLLCQATMWIAPVFPKDVDFDSVECSHFNLKIESDKDEMITKRETDFIGPNIDEGFRLSLFSAQSKVAIDPKLSYIIDRYNESYFRLCKHDPGDRIKIVSYEKLKGVHDNRIYPIIWYYDKWQSEDFMLYDEHVTNEVARKYYENKDRDCGEYKISCLRKMYSDLTLNSELDYIVDIVEELRKSEPEED